MLAQLIQALQCLPGVGAKSAQRIAFHLLNKDRDGASRLALALEEANTRVGHCERCRMLTEDARCIFCISERRDGMSKAQLVPVVKITI